MRLNPKKSARENAARLLPRLAEEFFKAGDKAAGPNPPLKRLHPFRILTKRFRYALEYFRACYGPAMDRYLSQVKDLQQSLGELNDCVSSRAVYRRLFGGGEVEGKGWPAALDGREAELAKKFQTQWRSRFHRPLRQKFVRYLANPAVRRTVKGGGGRRADLPGQKEAGTASRLQRSRGALPSRGA